MNDGMGGLPDGPSNVEYGMKRMGEPPLDAVRYNDAQHAHPLRTNDLGSLIGAQNHNGLPAGGSP